MKRHVASLSLAFALFSVGANRGFAQGPTIEPGTAIPGGERSSLGPALGESGSQPSGGPGGTEGILGGRPGPSVPRAPTGITTPGPVTVPGRMGIGLPEALPITDAPVYGPLSLPAGDEDGPPDGLTLDAAIERLVRTNLELRAKSLEIPQAQADILTASLRANPIFYADTQMVPYGSYSEKRPGGPVQYDVNVTLPLDVTRKRRARTVVAHRAKRVLEAQYQDAVRLQIDNLYTAYVDVLAARETVRFAEASIVGLDQVLEVTRKLLAQEAVAEADVSRVRIQRDAAQLGLAQAEGTLRRAKRTLAALLNLPPGQFETLELRGSIRDLASRPPELQAMANTALGYRPDLMAQRLGLGRAEADVKLAYANRMQDVFLLAQPYTFQDNSPFGEKSAHSWALGVTVPLPLFNRNQGNIERAKVNVTQTKVELSALERQVLTEVEQAEQDYALTRAAVESIEHDLLPAAREVRDNAFRLFQGGESDVIVYLNAQRDYNELVRQYRDALIQHRRSMLDLNTAVGQRILP